MVGVNGNFLRNLSEGLIFSSSAIVECIMKNEECSLCSDATLLISNPTAK